MKKICRLVFEKFGIESSNKTEVEQREERQERRLLKALQGTREKVYERDYYIRKVTRSQSLEKTSENNNNKKKTHVNHR